MNHRERMETVLSGEQADRVPVALWQHFPVDDQTPEGLVEAVLHFQRTYDFDIVKVTAESGYFAKGWGVEDVWEGDPEGTRRKTHLPIKEPEDWLKLKPLDPATGLLADQVAVMGALADILGPDVPLIPTIFSPLGTARKMAGQGVLLSHMRQYPEAVHAGLNTITESSLRFMEELRSVELSGIFYAVQMGQFGLLSSGEFEEFGRNYDLQVLGALGDWWLNVLHLHGKDVMFDSVSDYPVQVINWHDTETLPSLSGARRMFGGVVCGGLRQWATMVKGNPDKIRAEANAAIEETNGKSFLLGTGCVTPITAPHGNILAARKSVEK